jgi:hypothetical protein
MSSVRATTVAVEKKIIIAYSKRVFVDLGIQQARLIRHVVICGQSGSVIFLYIIFQKAQFSGGKIY